MKLIGWRLYLTAFAVLVIAVLWAAGYVIYDWRERKENYRKLLEYTYKTYARLEWKSDADKDKPERQADDGTYYKPSSDNGWWVRVTRQAKDGTVYVKVGEDLWKPLDQNVMGAQQCLEEVLKRSDGSWAARCFKGDPPSDFPIHAYADVGGYDLQPILVALGFLVVLLAGRYWGTWLFTGKLQRRFP